MLKKMFAMLPTGLLLTLGCSSKTEPVSDSPPTSATAGRVTIYVAGMIEKQNITWKTWPNRVHEALSGLPGVESVEVDAKKDLCHVAYDPARVSHVKLLDTIKGTGFDGEIQQAKGEGAQWRKSSAASGP